jgi:hypothetical protein
MKGFKLFVLMIWFCCSCGLSDGNKTKNAVTDFKTDTLSYYRKPEPVIMPVKTDSRIDRKGYSIIGDSIITKEKTRRLSYKFNYDTTHYKLKSIVVYSNSIKIQKIKANKEIENKNFELVDWNFDGYKDISVLYNCGSGGCAYWIWNYSKESGRYYYNRELSKWSGLEIDEKAKHIIFHYRGGWEDEEWRTYRYRNNKLIFVKGVHRHRNKLVPIVPK